MDYKTVKHKESVLIINFEPFFWVDIFLSKLLVRLAGLPSCSVHTGARRFS